MPRIFAGQVGALAILAGLSLPALAVAQQDTTKLPVTVLNPIVVTAERRPTPASDAVAPVFVLNRSDLARRGATDVTTVLNDAPGVQPEAVVGSGSGIYLQGLGSDRVLVLLDGAPLAGRLNGQFDLSRISTSQLERIEVVEGPQSTLYGSTALGGVVNLITRRDALPGAELTTTAGSFGQRDLSARLSTPVAGLFASLEGGRRTVDAVPGANPGTSGGADRWDWLGRVAGDLGHTSFDARLMAIAENQHYSIAPDNIKSTNTEYDALARLMLGAGGQTEIRLHGSWYDHRFADDQSPPATWDRQRVADLELVRTGTLGPSTWVAGAKADRDWLLSDRVSGYSRAATTGALYASAEWALAPALRVTTGLRLTESQLWGADLSPRLGAALRSASGLYLKAEVAHGFRAPSFEEQYFDLLQAQFGYAVHGNPDLRPEQSWNGTGEIGLARAQVHLFVRGFANSLRDFIEANQSSDSSGIAIYTYENVGRARTGGVETGASLTRGIATASASYTWLSTKDIDTNTDLLGRAAQTANASLTVGRPGWSARGEAIYTGEMPVARDQAGVVTYQGAFTRINVNGVLTLTRNLSLTLGADNLMDAKPTGAALVYGRRVYAQAGIGLGW